MCGYVNNSTLIIVERACAGQDSWHTLIACLQRQVGGAYVISIDSVLSSGQQLSMDIAGSHEMMR